MNNIKKTLTRQLLGAAIAAALITPAIASAQDVAAYNDGASQQIQGTVSAINGAWNITVNDSSGYTDSVALRQGTIINPTGLTLEPGMNVTIDGYADGPDFDALEIDTPYQYQGPAPVAVYYGSGTWYPGYATGWGPSFSLFFNTGTHRYEQRSFNFGGQVRRPMAPPAGWENRPHGYIGNAGNARPPRTAYVAPQRAQQQQPQRNFAPPQRQRPQRNFAPPQQQQPQRNFAPQQQQQPQRNFAPPQQQQPQRNFAPQQQQQPQRNFAPAQQHQPLAHNFAPPQPQQQRAAAPQEARRGAPADRQDGNGRRR